MNEALNHFGWFEAMLDCWDLVNLPKGKKSVGCKWVFTVKVNPDGSVARLNVRLVALGYAQAYGVDYLDTFSTVAKLTSVRLFISLAASRNWSISWISRMSSFLVIFTKKCI